AGGRSGLVPPYAFGVRGLARPRFVNVDRSVRGRTRSDWQIPRNSEAHCIDWLVPLDSLSVAPRVGSMHVRARRSAFWSRDVGTQETWLEFALASRPQSLLQVRFCPAGNTARPGAGGAGAVCDGRPSLGGRRAG